MSDQKLQAKIVNLHGKTMMSVDKLTIKGDDIAMTGNIMGTMPGTFYVAPIQLWIMAKMMDRKTVFAMIRLLRKGRRDWKQLQKPAGTANIP